MTDGLDQILKRGVAPDADVAPGPGETLDAVCRGEVLLLQRRDGYRFSVDAILLAAFAGQPRGRVVDFGTGSGVISLLLARRGAQSVVGLELQPQLFDLAWRNVQLNRCQERVNIVNADLRQLRGVLPPDTFDLAVSNPPYIARGTGHVNPVPEKALARHELTCSVPELARAGRYLLREGGAFKLIFPAPRLVELLGGLAAAGLEPRRIRAVHSLPNRPAKLVLVEAIKGGCVGLEVLPPVLLFDEAGAYTPEVQRVLSDARATLDPELPEVLMGGKA